VEHVDSVGPDEEARAAAERNPEVGGQRDVLEVDGGLGERRHGPALRVSAEDGVAAVKSGAMEPDRGLRIGAEEPPARAELESAALAVEGHQLEDEIAARGLPRRRFFIGGRSSRGVACRLQL
jgi:hypothetical protein